MSRTAFDRIRAKNLAIATTLLQHIQPPIDTVVQVGLGSWDEGPALLQSFPHADYFAVEPIQYYCELARKFGFPGVITEGLAWNITGLTREIGNRWSKTSAFNSVSRGKAKTIEAKTWTIDDLVRDQWPVGTDILLWLDCEGSELRALSGIESLVDRIRYILVEYRDDPPPGWATSDDIFRWMMATGFALVDEWVERTATQGVFRNERKQLRA